VGFLEESMRIASRRVITLVATAAVVALVGCGSSDEESVGGGGEGDSGPIKIGQLEPLTGSAAIYGLANEKAVEMAVTEINDAGGVDVGGTKRQVEVVPLDDECDPEKGVAAFQRLVNQEETKLIVGTTCSAVALAYQPLLARSEALSIVTGASSPDIAKPPGMFQYRATSKDYANAYLASMDRLAPKTVAILLDQTHPGWVATKPAVVEGLQEKGIEVVDEQEYKHNDTDFYTQLTAMKSKNPDLVMLMGGYANDDAKIWRQAKELKMDSQFITQLAGTAKDYLEQVKAPVVEGYYGVATPTMADFQADGYQPAIDFEKRFKEETGEDVGFTTLSTYSGFYALIRAIEKAGSDDPAEVAKALEEMKTADLEEVIEPVIPGEGDALFGDDGAVSFSVLLKEWQDGELVKVEEFK
jgi:branched-chain amino acid transport system substrate-binding protein